MRFQVIEEPYPTRTLLSAFDSLMMGIIKVDTNHVDEMRTLNGLTLKTVLNKYSDLFDGKLAR